MKTNRLHIIALSVFALTACSNHGAKHHEEQVAPKAKPGADILIPEKVQSNCLSCHTVATKNEPTNALAPPLFAVKNHLKAFSEREDFIEHVVNWVQSPDAKQASMPGAVKKFGLMPAMTLADEDLREIAAWLYDTPMQKPEWYAKHYKKEHGSAPSE